ncbi:MAG TPA: hypothetical protein VMW64_07470 [Dehalococcoidia bacterium]|nr:hypothetical protein [Dehalococcoidia bacterium]
MDDDSVEKLWDSFCCCSDDHTIREGGSHINLIQLKKLAEWPYLAISNVLVPASEKYPLACAVVCDRCLENKPVIRYAMAGKKGPEGAIYERIPLEQLKTPEFYWPDHHPDR